MKFSHSDTELEWICTRPLQAILDSGPGMGYSASGFGDKHVLCGVQAPSHKPRNTFDFLFLPLSSFTIVRFTSTICISCCRCLICARSLFVILFASCMTHGLGQLIFMLQTHHRLLCAWQYKARAQIRSQ